MASMITSTPQLPFKIPQILSNRDHKALDRATLVITSTFWNPPRSLREAARLTAGCGDPWPLRGQQVEALLVLNRPLPLSVDLPTVGASKIANIMRRIPTIKLQYCRIPQADLKMIQVRFRLQRTHTYIWQRIKNIGLVTGLGGHFATKVCNRRGCSATNPSATSPLKTRVLYTEVRDKGL